MRRRPCLNNSNRLNSHFAVVEFVAVAIKAAVVVVVAVDIRVHVATVAPTLVAVVAGFVVDEFFLALARQSIVALLKFFVFLALVTRAVAAVVAVAIVVAP